MRDPSHPSTEIPAPRTPADHALSRALTAPTVLLRGK